MKRSMQEVVELVIFALIALLVGTGVVWLAGWMLGLVGTVLTWLAGLVWSLLRFLVPIAVVAGAVYLLVKLMNRSAERVAGEPQKQPATPPSPWTMSKEPKEASGSEAAAAGSESSRPDEPKPPATERWEGEGGSVTTGDDADESAAASDTHEPRSEGSAPATDEAPTPSPGGTAGEADEARDEGDEEDEERRRGDEPG